jgi:hypothetical protein
MTSRWDNPLPSPSRALTPLEGMTSEMGITGAIAWKVWDFRLPTTWKIWSKSSNHRDPHGQRWVSWRLYLILFALAADLGDEVAVSPRSGMFRGRNFGRNFGVGATSVWAARDSLPWANTNVSHHLLGTTTCSAPFMEGYPGAFIIITQRIGLWDLYKYI